MLKNRMSILAMWVVVLTGCPLDISTGDSTTKDPVFAEPTLPPDNVSDEVGDDPTLRQEQTTVAINAPANRHIYLDGTPIDAFTVTTTIIDEQAINDSLVTLPRQGVLRLVISNINGTGVEFTDYGFVKNGLNKFRTKPPFLGQILAALEGYGDYTVSKFLIRVTAIDVYSASKNGWVSLVDYGPEGKVVDFIPLKDGVFFDLGTFSVAPDTYTAVRLVLGQSEQQVTEGATTTKPIYFSDDQDQSTILGGYHDFTVEALKPLTVGLDIDVIKNFGRNEKKQFVFTPTLKASDDSTSPVIKTTIKPHFAAKISLIDSVTIEIPADTVDEKTVVSLKPSYKLSRHGNLDYISFGREYLIEGISALPNNATVTYSYPANQVPSLGLSEGGLDIMVFDPATGLWAAAGQKSSSTSGAIVSTVSTIGLLGVGGPIQSTGLSQSTCDFLSDSFDNLPIPSGIDRSYFGLACQRRQNCYLHGSHTYGKNAAWCNFDFLTDLFAKCEDLCINNPQLGEKCRDLSDSEKAIAQGISVWSLYQDCRFMAQLMYQKAMIMTDDFAPSDLATCLDYDSKGVQCTPPTCTLSVDKTEVAMGAANDLTFTLNIGGSISDAEFDNTLVFKQGDVALPGQHQITIQDIGRQLSEPTTFMAVLNGPGEIPGNSTICSVTVNIASVQPCSIVIIPPEIYGGTQAILTLTVEKDYYPAQMDIRTENVFRNVGLSAPDANGRRYFSSYVSPSLTRMYNARVWSTVSGDLATCAARLGILP